MPVLFSGGSSLRDGEGVGVVSAIQVCVMCRVNEGIEVESKTKMKPGKNSFSQILHRYYQVRSSQNRDGVY